MEFNAVLGEYGPMLSRIVASYEVDPAQQQEVLQDVSLALWQALPKFRGDGSLKAFVARVAQNRAVSHVAKAANRPRQAELNDEIICKADGPEVRLEKEQQRAQLLYAVRALPLNLRQVTTLALEGFSHREIAETLGISENNAMVRFSRAKEALKLQMARGNTVQRGVE
ncbi:RNA polymerase sigma factor [Kordiimonas aestuarii]|uniref:RNA polymerase sigma factor n=1 Tax=Kordiimonas aestuarii TaxID=1005925 RepID=UPI0021D2222C|nr:sigma-70 family RNA polymerase sigma factor [Kordiimonas aestuarii]